jgi:4'-phosphopantetheinyl transferase
VRRVNEEAAAPGMTGQPGWQRSGNWEIPRRSPLPSPSGPGAPLLVVQPGTVDVWQISLTAMDNGETEATCWTWLDEAERQRAERFRQGHHRRRFVIAHGQLRLILARYLGLAPAAIRFCQGDRGKPAILGPGEEQRASGAIQTQQALQFNLSHSGELALVGISPHRVGIDLEQRRFLPDSLSMAERFFSVKEFDYLQSLNNEAEQSGAFLAYWVCKEAYVKATGEGLVDQLSRVVLDLLPQPHWRCLPDADPECWQLRCFAPSTESFAAVVVEQSSPLQCRWFDCPPRVTGSA